MATAAAIGMASSLLLVGLIAKSRKQQNWFVYTIAGATMLGIVVLDWLGIVSVFY